MGWSPRLGSLKEGRGDRLGAQSGYPRVFRNMGSGPGLNWGEGQQVLCFGVGAELVLEP